jgi:hypothetical protein
MFTSCGVVTLGGDSMLLFLVLESFWRVLAADESSLCGLCSTVLSPLLHSCATHCIPVDYLCCFYDWDYVWSIVWTLWCITVLD